MLFYANLNPQLSGRVFRLRDSLSLIHFLNRKLPRVRMKSELDPNSQTFKRAFGSFLSRRPHLRGREEELHRLIALRLERIRIARGLYYIRLHTSRFAGYQP